MDRLLLLTADPPLYQYLAHSLQEHGYTVDRFLSSDEAFAALQTQEYALCLLDTSIADMTAFDLSTYGSKRGHTLPTIFITPFSKLQELLHCFKLDANGYLKKPFELDELLIRIRHQLTAATHPDKVQLGPFTFLPRRQSLQCHGQTFSLRQKEAQILLYLTQQHDRVISCDELIEHIWSSEQIPTYATIRTYIKNLRKIMGNKAIENIKGLGYRLDLLPKQSGKS